MIDFPLWQITSLWTANPSSQMGTIVHRLVLSTESINIDIGLTKGWRLEQSSAFQPPYGDQNQILTFYPPTTHRVNTTIFLETKPKAFIHLYFIQVRCAAFVIIILRVIGNFLTYAEGRDPSSSEQAREKHCRKIIHL